MLLPDPGDPTMAYPEEYNPLSAEWSDAMNARCAKTEWVGHGGGALTDSDWRKIAVRTRVWRDIAANFFNTSATGLSVRVALVRQSGEVSC